MIGAVALPPLRDDVRTLALNYVPARHRDSVRALWALDEALGQIVRTTTEPMIGQMRLTWWRERLSGINNGERAAEPVLQALTGIGVGGDAMADMVEGWEVLLDPLPLSDAAIADHARMRGGALFALCAQLLGSGDDVTVAGAGWAAMDLAQHCSDADTAVRAQQFALTRLAAVRDPKAKALRILTRVAKGDARRPIGTARSRFDVLRAVIF
jgi:15-cis-phytoene synthase